MSEMIFEWAENKDRSNFKKHGLRFEEASGVFDDPLRLTWLDRIESGEQRWKTIGSISAYRIILVAHLIREERGTEVIRIISARRVTTPERKSYETENG